MITTRSLIIQDVAGDITMNLDETGNLWIGQADRVVSVKVEKAFISAFLYDINMLVGSV